MAFGFKSLNNSGIVQIDSEYQNLHLVYEGTGTTGQAIPFPAGYSHSDVLILVGSTPTDVAIVLSSLTDNDFTCRGRGVRDAPDVIFNFPYRIYAKASALFETSDYGLIVNNDVGAKTFDSRLKPIRVSHYETVDSVDSQPFGYTPVSGPWVSIHGSAAPAAVYHFNMGGFLVVWGIDIKPNWVEYRLVDIGRPNPAFTTSFPITTAVLIAVD